MTTKATILFSSAQVAILVLIVKFLGLIKQSVIAAYCGATLETDAFFIASGAMVNISVILFSAISVSLLTIYIETLISRGRKAANELINNVLVIFLPISFLLTVIFYFGAPFVAAFLAPAYGEYENQILSGYIRKMSIIFCLWCYFLIINVILEADKKFIYGKGQALFQNLFLIIGAGYFYKTYGIDVLLYAFIISGVAQCFIVTFYTYSKFKFTINYRYNKTINNYNIKRLLKLAIPVFLGNAIYEINTIVDGQIATGIGVGSASVLNYGATIHDMVVGVIVTSISTVLFSHFTSWVAENDIDKVEDALRRTIEILVLILLPIMSICIIAGDQIITIFYGRGNFGSTEIKLTYEVVIGYSVGFVFQATRANLVKVYYAFQNSKTPMINGILAVLLNIALSLTLSKIFGVAGIALATSISMFFVTVLLFVGIKKYIPKFTLKESGEEIFKSVIAILFSSLIIIFLKINLQRNMILSFITECVTILILYPSLLYLFKSYNINKFKKYLVLKLGGY